MDNPDRLILATAEASVEIRLDGGAIGHYRLTGSGGPVDLLRAYAGPAAGPTDPLAAAAFPLVPYFSGIRNGRFRFGGRTHQLRLNFGDHPHSVHGVGWQAIWKPVETDGRHAVIGLDYLGGADWPFPIRATQSFQLDGPDLHHEMALTNTGAETMPVGMGLHPYLPRRDGARLQANVGNVWIYDATMLPAERVPVSGHLDLSTGQDVDDLKCDTVFEPWDGHATVSWPGAGMEMEISADADLNRLCVYAPDGADHFCVEPVSQITDAFNRTADGAPAATTGMRTLAPGETWAQGVRFRPRPV